eukprot:m.141280 g.141280  ORF g.141280 m.141280 type:complete len:58 (+) comp38337_c0_seq10:115-288(+)
MTDVIHYVLLNLVLVKPKPSANTCDKKGHFICVVFRVFLYSSNFAPPVIHYFHKRKP